MKNFSYVPIDLESRYAIRKKLRASGHFEWNKNYSARDLFVVYDIYLSIQFHWFADFCCMLDVWVFGIDNFQINEIHLHLVFSVKHSERPPCSHRHIYISAQRNAYYSFWMMASLCHWVKKKSPASSNWNISRPWLHKLWVLLSEISESHTYFHRGSKTPFSHFLFHPCLICLI